MTADGRDFTWTDFDVGEVRLRCALAGPPGGQVVILLHGFPECGASWLQAAGALARDGYRTVVPDLRGYGGSGRPAPVAAYAIPRLVGDIAGLVRALEVPRAHLVGHDWGGVVAWWTAMLRPEVVDRLAIVNAPHPVGYAAALRTAEQLRRGWYVFFFQLPWVPEWALALRDYGAVRAVFEKDGIGAAEVSPCVASIRQVGARSAAINYYRASVRAALSGKAPRPRKIEAPTLVLWGEKDRFLVPALAQPPSDWVSDARVVRLPGATHWAQIDAADQVASELSAFFRQ